MPGATTYYGLSYFTFGDKPDSIINVQKEIERFYIIDRQLYGLYSIFGNGVIDGWDVYDNGFSLDNGISVGITSGNGIINSIAARSALPVILGSIPANSSINIYAVASGDDILGLDARFVATNSLPASNMLLLATVTAGSNGIALIDNNVRAQIGFKQAVFDAIMTHRHRGSPSKIDLLFETKNQLPGAKLEDFSAEKLVTGRIDSNLLSPIDHEDLGNAGVLTHAQLDAIYSSIIASGKQSFGEVAACDLLQQILFLKTIYPEVDEYMFNEISVVPGASSAALIDYNNTSAYVNDISGLTGGCIIGEPTLSDTTYFFTNNFLLPDVAKRLLLTANTSVPSVCSIAFGYNTTDSVNFDSDYTLISQNSLAFISTTNKQLRIGAKLVYAIPPSPLPGMLSFVDFIDFNFTNVTGLSNYFHFKISFYEDIEMTNLLFSVFSSNNQEGWLINNIDSLAAGGVFVDNLVSIDVSFYPIFISALKFNKIYYLKIESYDVGTNTFTTEGTAEFVIIFGGGSDSDSIDTNPCDIFGYLPIIKNFAVMFDMANNKKIMLNVV